MGLKKEIKHNTDFLNEIDLVDFLKKLYKTRRKDAHFFVCESKLNKEPDAEKPWIQKGFRVSEIQQAIDYILQTDLKDIYVSGSIHNSRYSRATETVIQIPAIILDLDFKKLGKYQDLSAEEIILKLEKEYFKTGKIPHANGIVFSGNGIYLLWWFSYTPGTPGTIKKKQVVMKILYEMLKDYGADDKSLDTPHVFRPSDTYNAKNELKLVRTLTNNLPDYTLAQFARELPSLWDVWKKDNGFTPNKPKKAKKGKNKPNKTKIIPVHKEKTLAHDYIKSLFQLVDIREGLVFSRKAGTLKLEGSREFLCFVVRNYYHTMHRDRFYSEDQDEREKLFSESLKVAEKMNTKFSKPLPQKELENQTLNAKKLYRFKWQTIVDKLDITLDEQTKLKVKTKEGKRHKSKLQMRELRGSQGSIEDYNQKRKEDKKHLLNMLRRILDKNPKAKRKELADLLGVHPTYITKLKKEL